MVRVATFDFEAFGGASPAPALAPKPKKPVAIVETPQPQLPAITEQDLEQARREAFQRGFTQGADEEKKKINREQQAEEEAKRAVLQSIASGLDHLRKEYGARMRKATEIVPDLVAGIAKKVAGRELRVTPLPLLRETVRTCLVQLIEEPLLTVHVHPDLMHDMEEELRSLSQTEGYEGILKVAVDDRLALQDCRIEWQNGMLERNSAQLLAQVDALLKDQHLVLRSKLAIETYDKFIQSPEAQEEMVEEPSSGKRALEAYDKFIQSPEGGGNITRNEENNQ